jgi:hypothetical protein
MKAPLWVRPLILGGAVAVAGLAAWWAPPAPPVTPAEVAANAAAR